MIADSALLLILGAALVWVTDALNTQKSLAFVNIDYVPDPKATEMGNINASNIKKRDDTVPVKHKKFNVTIMAFKHTDFISDKFKRNKDWDGSAVARFCSYFKKFGSKGNFVDVRPGIGTYTLPIAKCMLHYGGRVIAIEDRPQVAGNLRWGLKYNHLDNVRLYQYALGAPTSGRSTWSGEWHKNVPVTTLDAILAMEKAKPNKIFGMKLDLEGKEADALYGARRLFKTHGPCVLFVQLQYDPMVEKLLHGMGYVRKHITPRWGNHWFERANKDECEQ